MICEKAAALRKAGVLSVEVDGFKAELAPMEIELPRQVAALKELDPDIDYSDPYDDPQMYGRSDGEPAPGFQRPYSTLRGEDDN